MNKPRAYTCQDCGAEGLSHGRRGKLPKRCQSCKANKKQPARLYGVVCRHCNKEFHASHRSRMYCSDCLPIYRPAAEQFQCKACGDFFTTRGGRDYLIYCSRQCWFQDKFAAAGANRKRQKQIRQFIDAVNAILRPRDDAVRNIIAKLAFAKPCRGCGAMMPRDDGAKGDYERFCSNECRIATRKRKQAARRRGRGTQKHTSRARRRGLPRQYSIRLPKVAERDGWICQLCREVVDPETHHAEPLAACIDHIVPLNMRSNTRHGHVWDNVQLAHRACNERKGCSISCGSLLECDNPRQHVRTHCIDQAPPRWGKLAQEAFPETPRPLCANFRPTNDKVR